MRKMPEALKKGVLKFDIVINAKYAYFEGMHKHISL